MRLRTLGLVLVAIVGAYLPAVAGQPSSARRAANSAPVKECIRLNGRMGYYANPWCTREEQLRWDRWEARRIARQ